LAPGALNPMRDSSASVKIRLRNLPPAAGLQWIRRGFRTFWRRPLGFIGLWLFFTLCLFVIMVLAVALSPLVMLAIAALLPLLTVGYMQATSDVLDDLKLRPSVFRAPFASTPQVARSMLVIMLIYMAAVALLAVCADAMDGGETRRWLHAVMTPPVDGKPPVVPPISEASVSSMRFMMLGMTLVSIPLWYAPALVLWGRQGAAQSLFSSVVALWRTKGAFATFLLGWMVVGVAFDAIVQLLAAAFGLEAISLAALTGQMMLSITYFLSMWFGFVDTFEITSPVAFRTVMADNEPPAA
jgi:hypothetical protein